MTQREINFPDVLGGCESAQAWEHRRTEILELFASKEYGKRPNLDYQVTWEEETRERVAELSAVHIHTNLTVSTKLGAYSFPVTVFLPEREEKVPAAVLICSQEKIKKPMNLPPEFAGKKPEELAGMLDAMLKKFGIEMEGGNLLASMMPTNTDENGNKMVGSKPLLLDSEYDNGHWPVRRMMERGLAMIGFYAFDAEADDAKAYPSGLAKIFGTTAERAKDEWGVLAVWAFAASCVMDYVTTIPEIDTAKVGITGHSRCGKAALWCGANDTRFAAVMPNGSGCCGAALSRGKQGENIASIQAFFPHWFAPAYRNYIGKEMELPFDQHFLLAAVAPRILHVGSGSEDAWAHPAGEYYATVLAAPVWELYGNETFADDAPGEDGVEAAGKVGYHLRKGPHKLDTFDWECFCSHMMEK